MNTQTPTQKTQPQGWHPADIVAGLRKRGWSLRRLSVHNGYAPTVMASALRRPWPKAERLIAEVLAVPPQDVWPERYGADGKTNRRPGPRSNDASKHTGESRRRNGKAEAVN